MIANEQHTKTQTLDYLIKEFARHGQYGVVRTKAPLQYVLYDQDRFMMTIVSIHNSKTRIIRISGFVLSDIKTVHRSAVDSIIAEYSSYVASKGYTLGMQGNKLVLTREIVTPIRLHPRHWVRLVMEMHQVFKGASEIRLPISDILNYHLSIRLN